MRISGSKNASLPIIAATLVTAHNSVLYNVPKITDVSDLISILNKTGSVCKFDKNKLTFLY